MWRVALLKSDPRSDLLPQTQTRGRQNRLALAPSLQALQSILSAIEASVDRCLVTENSVEASRFGIANQLDGCVNDVTDVADLTPRSAST